MAAKIQAVDKSTVARICSGQVVVELATAVKELVENSIDAGATTVKVQLRDHGTTCIEVSDNGSGISPENYAGLTAKYHTSKLSSFDDLQVLISPSD
jgi:DNA mismatch repair protein PMS2